jgi:hypothetical protein
MADDKRLYHWVYIALAFGLGASGALLVAGVIASLIARGALPQMSLQLGEALRAASRGDGEGLASLGILSLMLSPALVVAVAGIAAATKRDWRTVVTSVLVFGIMLIGTTLGQK